MYRKSAFDAIENKLYEMLPPIHGTWFFVDPTDGSATKSARTMSTAVASIVTAYGKCTTGRGDGICIISRGITTAGCTSYLSAVLDWAKWGITVVGIGAPTRMGQRTRIANLSTATDLAYLIDVQGSNNAFYNLHVGNFGSAAAAVGGLKVTGDRNYLEGIHVVGGGGHTGTANDYDLSLSGDENTFKDCVFGSDTFDRGDNASANLILPSGALAARDRFIDCEFLQKRSAGTTALGIKLLNSDAICRDIVFSNCHFSVYRDGAVAAEVAVVGGTAPNNGFLVFRHSTFKGYVDWKDIDSAFAARVVTHDPVGADNGGKYVLANPS